MGDQPLTRADFQGFTEAFTSALTALTKELANLTAKSRIANNIQSEKRGIREELPRIGINDIATDFSNKMRAIINRVNNATEKQQSDRGGEPIRVPRDENNHVVIVKNPSSDEEEPMKKEHNHGFLIKTDVLSFNGTLEVVKTIPEGVMNELISNDLKKSKVDAEKQQRSIVRKEYDDVMMFFSKKRFPVGMYKLQPRKYGQFKAELVLYPKKNSRYNKPQPSNDGPDHEDVVLYPEKNSRYNKPQPSNYGPVSADVVRYRERTRGRVLQRWRSLMQEQFTSFPIFY